MDSGHGMPATHRLQSMHAMVSKLGKDADMAKFRLRAPRKLTRMSTLINALDLTVDNRLPFPSSTMGSRPPLIENGERGERTTGAQFTQRGTGFEKSDQMPHAESRPENITYDSDDSMVHDQSFSDNQRLRYADMWGNMPPDEDLQKRRKRARAWIVRAGCLEALKEDRLRAIEKIMQTKGFMELDDEGEDEKMAEEKVLLERGALYSDKLGWEEFTLLSEPKAVASRFAALLIERPVPETAGSRRFGKRARRPAMVVQTLDGTPQVERIRFTADEASHVLQEIMASPPPASNEAVIRPFKPLFAYYDELRSWYDAKKDTLDGNTSHLADKRVDHAEETKPDFERSHSQGLDPDLEDGSKKGFMETDAAHDYNKIIIAEAILKMMDTDLKDITKLHLDCRRRRQHWMQFDDLWHCFFPGDLVYDPKLDQALRVLCVQNGRTILDPFSELSEKKAEEAPKMLGSKNAFAILTFSVGSDGQCFGPVQHLYNIDAWDGERRVTSLPIYPLEHADLTANEGAIDSITLPNAKEASLRSRGRKFCEIANTPQLAHRDYRGFGLGQIREEIDSDIIIDIGLYYDQHPSDTPIVGLTHPPQGDKREVFDNIHFINPDKASNEVFDDREIEADRMTAFINGHRSSLLQRTPVGVDLTEDQMLLLPRGVWAYVLRSRGWYLLDVTSINPLEQRNQSFDDLVLQTDYKRLVQSLVKTHSTGTRPTSNSVGRSENNTRADLVRGKGKGVIILLHGVPGVGKSSTAECVAEYTKRPLLSVTCGDIGQTAEAVQKSLEYHLNLAHRWGCVMLLDEADVFMASRDKRDLQRNAIVSVFLRVLEYYSGILFLTTNKIGTFDEAFKSRIHLSLYYDKLDADQTWKIWDVNLTRQLKLRPHLSINREELLKWGERNYRQCIRDGTQIWNGRQIRNACQTAAALAEADGKGAIEIDHLRAVARASLEFDGYLRMVYGGDDADRVRRAGEREDAYTSRGRASYPSPDDDARYRDYYHERDRPYDYGYAERRMSAGRGSRAYYGDRGHDRYDGRGGDREDVRYASERPRSPAAESFQRPRDRFDGRAGDRDDIRFAPERHMSPGTESVRRPRA